jgi:hypothetical protein
MLQEQSMNGPERDLGASPAGYHDSPPRRLMGDVASARNHKMLLPEWKEVYAPSRTGSRLRHNLQSTLRVRSIRAATKASI